MTRRSRTRAALAVLLAALVGLSACTPQPTGPSSIYVSNTNVNSQGSGGPSASPSPGSGGGTLPEGSTVRVAIFGQDCQPGTTPPPNGTGQIKVACRGAAITATPKAANGQDLPPEVHGTLIEWAGPVGAAGVSCTPSYLGNSFNQFCTCSVAGGTFTLSAKVKNVTGVFVGTCIP